MTTERYTVGELAELGGVSRRTVRYYVQEGLIPAPDGLGRGARYGQGHLDRLLRVKALQEQGLTLDAVRDRLDPRRRTAAAVTSEPVDLVPRSVWTRVELMPGVELQLSNRHQVPSPAKLAELARWFREHFRDREEDHA